jgi:hypothetical protein
MATPIELQQRIDHLEQLLREKDAAELKAKADAAEQKAKTEDALAAAARVEAASAEREQIRRGAWVSYYLGKADPNARVDLAAIDEAVPADADKWPPGTDPSMYAFSGGSTAKNQPDISQTHMGKLLRGKK